jgi:hypothetical protein
MTNTTYQPGAWYGIVTANSVALLPATVDSELAIELWNGLDSGTGFSGLLDVLTAAFGAGLSSFPYFAIVDLDSDDARVAVRGPLRIEVTASDSADPLTITGDQVKTWNERVVTNPHAITLIVANATTAEPSLPVRSGVVRSEQLHIIVTDSPTGNLTKAAFSIPARSDDARTPDPELTTSDPGATLSESPIEEDSSSGPRNADATEAVSFSNYDDLWGETIAASVESAAIRPPSDDDHATDPPTATPPPTPKATAPPTPAPAPMPATGMISGIPSFDTTPAAPAADQPAVFGEHNDHDGETISLSQLQQMQATPASASTSAARPAGRILLSTGEEAVLDRSVIIGRRPRATRVSGGDVPHLLAVPSPLQDISRSHVEIRIEGVHVLAQDLDTTNGTILRRGDDPPIRLHPGEATMIANEDVLDLGEGITVTFAGLS